WFAERGNPAITTRIVGTTPLTSTDPETGLAIVEAKGRRAAANYLLPLAIKWTRFDRERGSPNALAAVRHGAREGTLLDAAAEPSFVFFLFEKLRACEAIQFDQGRLEFKPTGKLPRDGAIAIHNV